MVLQAIVADSFNLWAQQQDLGAQVVAKEQLLPAAMPASELWHSTNINSYKILPQLLTAAVLNNLQLLKLSLLNQDSLPKANLGQNQQPQSYYLKLLFAGAFIDLLNFLVQLHNEHLALEYKELAFQLQHYKLVISMQLAIPAVVVSNNTLAQLQQLRFFKAPQRDPWQIMLTPQAGATPYLGATAVSNFALKQLRYLGYLTQQRQITALLMAPNGNIYEVANGELLGARQWQLQKITPTALLLKNLKTNKTYMLMRY